MSRFFKFAIPVSIIVIFFLSGCVSAPRYIVRRPVKGRPGEFVFDKQRGMASYYGEKFHGRATSSGQIFDMNGFTAAHRTLPLGTTVKVTNLDNNKSVEVVVNDRGPFLKGRIVDLSKAAAIEIGLIENGTAEVEIEVIESKE